MFVGLLESIGKPVISGIESVGRVTLVFLQTLTHLRFASLRLTIYQMAHLGVHTLPIVALTILFAGMVLTFQTSLYFVKYGAQASVGGMVAMAITRETGPLLAGIVAAGRVGAAITAEIGSMKVTEQIDALRVMAVNPISYLVVPRVIACGLMLPVLVVFADILGIAGGYSVAYFYAGISEYSFFQSIEFFTEFSDITGGLIKSMVFGILIATIACYKGLTAKEGAEGVGQAVTGSVVTSMILIFVSNFFLSVLLYHQ